MKQFKEMLLWCIAVNYAILIVWFGVFVFAHDWLFHLHTRWFRLTPESFDAIHYAGMAIYKVGIMLFNVAPFIALCVCSHSQQGNTSARG